MGGALATVLSFEVGLASHCDDVHETEGACLASNRSVGMGSASNCGCGHHRYVCCTLHSFLCLRVYS